MTNKIVILYDDTVKPGKEIRSITGDKSFGDTIYKRKKLKYHMQEMFAGMEAVECFGDFSKVKETRYETPVMIMKSSFIINDIEKVKTLVNKAIYAHDNYKVVTDNDKIACVILKDSNELINLNSRDFETFYKIESEGFVDISDVNNFRQFITSGFEARFFNSLSGDEYTVVKTSENTLKLKAEYTFYGLLPDSMKQWFVRPFDYKEEDGKASYKMQRYHMTDLAIRYIHGAITVSEFTDILDKLFFFVRSRNIKEVSEEEYENTAKVLYEDKVKNRVLQLKECKDYETIAKLIASLTKYNDIDEIVKHYLEVYEKVRGNRNFLNVQVVAHGDMCFSNILYNNDASMLVLIDPKGAMSEEELYMDPYYDLAKLSHSICGHYDLFNSDLFEISMDENLHAKLTVDRDNRAYVDVFKKYLSDNDIDFRLIRIYEASLFLSMLPLHMDRPKKVFAFILNALAIIDSLEEK